MERTQRHLGWRGPRLRAVVYWASLAMTLSAARAEECEGFLEPYRQIDIAAPEMGIVSQVLVREGMEVQPGDVLAELQHDSLLAALDIAKQSAAATGRIKSAQAELRLRKDVHRRLSDLQQRNHATQEEVDRAVVELEVAEASLLSVREELEIRELERRRIEKQIEERRLRSAIHGVVVGIYKDQGEFVAPNDPTVMTVVQLDPLKVIFSVSPNAAAQLNVSKSVELQAGDGRQACTGILEFVSPVTDPESGTVRIVVRVPNSAIQRRSGERCRLHLDMGSSETATKTTMRPGE